MKIDRAECHPAMDYDEHERSYQLFIKMSLIVGSGVVLLMIFLALFVA
ncbi:aa3-type cytochrome c oxidase subunit IV [Methyloligella sp. 2.7D]|nr:aa3-type cytochrome c oxidase subunit IV [Methyloligella sp. GL2]QKP76793.1 aa3-type cytochrome c oxidase subunit IV [Methyloligella sp. GL2]